MLKYNPQEIDTILEGCIQILTYTLKDACITSS